MRINTLWILTFLLLIAGGLGCDAGEGPDAAAEPPCDDHIDDEAYSGAYRAIVGFGEGTLPALRLALTHPGDYNVVVAMNGPTSAFTELLRLETLARDFDNWPAEPTRRERLRASRDWLAAYGNPFYSNEASAFYPPGVDADDFAADQPKTLPPIYSPENPNGQYNSVTFFDEQSGEAVDFWLAHDVNGNGRRDAGEPLILQLHEPFTDANKNGIWDTGESFQDFGLDGVAETEDEGEGNGKFDWNPAVAAWQKQDPAKLAGTIDLDLTAGYQNSIYLDVMDQDAWGYREQIELLAAALENRLAETETTVDDFCIRNVLGRYTGLKGDYPVLTTPIWFPEKFMLDVLPGANSATSIAAADALQTGRFYQALRFLSLRMPNGLDDIVKETPAIWQTRTYYSTALQQEVRFGIGFPAGYFDEISAWKSYPVIYVFHDRHSKLDDWSSLFVAQGDLAQRKLAKQALLIVLDGNRVEEGSSGYGHYINQAATEFGGNYGDVVVELMAYVEETFRVQVAYHDRDDED